MALRTFTSARLLAAVLAVAIGAAACSDAAAVETPTTIEAATAQTFLDESVIHSISVNFDETAYQGMLDIYSSSQTKEWIEATVTIDGVTYERAGMRLKGNSSLRGLGGRDGDFSLGDDPEALPWLIRLDRNIEGQEHEGITEIVVRSNNSATALNEAVALDLLEAAGLASQDSAYASFSVNGSDATLRLVMENPNDEWLADAFETAGVLYKAEAGGDYSYRGDNPAPYDEVFDLEAGEENGDLTPLIDFLEFINESDDATFDAELGDRLDIEAFATYLAMQDLIENFDDIDGPGNNSYLFYDTTTEQFTVVPWDHNLAFGERGFAQGRGDGGGQMPPGGEFPEGGQFPPPGNGQFTPPDGGQGIPPGGTDNEGRAGGFEPGGRPGMGRTNVLVERFLANPEWQQLYDDATERLQSELFDGGDAQAILDKWVTILGGAADLVSGDTVDAEGASIESTF